MLRHVLVISSSGLVLFQKQFLEGIAQPSLTGSLLIALQSLCRRSVGQPACYVGLSHVGVGLAADTDKSGVVCAVFGDASYGGDLLMLLARSVLATFLRKFRAQLSQPLVDTRAYNGFRQDLAACFRSASLTLIDEVHAAHPTLVNCVLIHGDRVSHETRPGNVDVLGVVANLKAAFDISADAMSSSNDTPREISLQLSHDSDDHKLQGARVGIYAIAPFYLVIISPASLDPAACRQTVLKTTMRLRQVAALLAGFSG